MPCTSEVLYSSYDLGSQTGFGPSLAGTYNVREFRVGFTAFTPVFGR